MLLKHCLRWLWLAVLIVMLPACGVSGYGAVKDHSRIPVFHEVRSGDTVWAISRRYGVSQDSILNLNRIVDRDKLEVGTRLHVGYRLGDGVAQQKNIPKNRNKAGGTSNVHLQTASLNNDRGSLPSSEGGFLLWPIHSGRIVSTFGPRGRSFHDGIDIACPEGTPIYAAHGGLVVYSGSKLGGYGKLILLRQDNGLTTVYAHNSKLLVKEGQRVRAGQLIAHSGSTGKSSGPHLHFEVRTKDSRGRYVAVDPLPLLTKGETAKPRWRINESLTPILAKIFD